MSTRKVKGDVKSASSQLIMPLSEKDKTLIKGSWGFVEKHWNYICVPAFERWFKSYPDLMSVFCLERYLTISDMVRSPFMMEHMNHVKNIMSYVINNIDEREKLTEHLLKLGKRHYKYGADQKYAQAFGVSLTYCLSVSKKWKVDDLNAWDSLIRYMINAFKLGIRLGAETAESAIAEKSHKATESLVSRRRAENTVGCCIRNNDRCTSGKTPNEKYSLSQQRQQATTSSDDNNCFCNSATTSERFDGVSTDYSSKSSSLPGLCKS